jgi:hypothetical protein
LQLAAPAVLDQGRTVEAQAIDHSHAGGARHVCGESSGKPCLSNRLQGMVLRSRPLPQALPAS